MSMFSIASGNVTWALATVCFERIKVDHHQVDGFDPVLGRGRFVQVSRE